MKIKKVLCAALSVAMLSSTLAGCGQDDGVLPDGRIQINFWGWGSPAEVEVYNQLVQQYMSENPNIFINYVHYESSIYMNKFMNEKDKPDVFFMPDTDFLAWADAGVMEDLTTYCTDEELNSVWPEAINEYYYNYETKTLGKSEGAALYGFPKDLGPVALVYNKKLVDQQITANGLNAEEVYSYLDPNTPMTWEQFRTLLKNLTADQDKNSSDQIYGIPYYEMDAAVYSNNADYIKDNATKQGIDENFIQAVAFNIQLSTVDQVMPSAAFSGGTDAYTRFLSGKSLFTWMGPWDNADFWDYESLEYDIIPVPYGPAEGASSVSFVGSMCYGVSAKSKQKEEAVKFAKWLCMGESCQQMAMDLGQQVPNLVDMADDFVNMDKQPANKSVFVDIMDSHSDSLGTYAALGKNDEVSGKTRVLYYTYNSTWRDNLFSYIDNNNLWEEASYDKIKEVLEAYRDTLQNDLDQMNIEWKGL